MNKRRPGIMFGDGQAEVLLWAPAAGTAMLELASGERIPLEQGERGYWHLLTGDVKPGDHYRFVLDDGDPLPDPASLSQPGGVHGPSEAVDLSAIARTGEAYGPVPLEDYIIYELHAGTFSDSSDFDGIIRRLDYLKELGITAIEIMPVAAFPGDRNWGYDGVFPYAVHNAYGGAAGLMRLVDACHERGLAVVLDVVYNHIGPEGNYLGSYGPYFTDKYKTPWGSAVNFDDAGCDGVRHFFIQNAIMWLQDFGIDALRMDAVHAIKDFSARHLLLELREELDAMMARTGGTHYLIIENDLNDVRYINPVDKGGFGMDAQWMDEFHHALRVTAGEPRTGYYSDFEGLADLAKSYRDAYVYDGVWSPHREKTFGSSAAGNGGHQFVVFCQNHDQVGNRMLGERIGSLVSFEMQKLMAAAVLLSPFLPLLFMGEEWGETAPFQYFVSHTDPELVEAVRKGRKEEFAAFQAEGEAPDPQSEETFNRSRLRWDALTQEPHATMLRYYKSLILLRKSHAALRPERSGVEAHSHEDQGLITLIRRSGITSLHCYLNFSEEVHTVPIEGAGRCVFNSAAKAWGGPDDRADGPVSGTTIKILPQSCLIIATDV